MIKSNTVQSLGEVKEILDNLSKEEKEENKKVKETLLYLNSFVKVKYDRIKSIKKALEDLNMVKLNQKSIAKIIDLMPEDAEDLRKIFVGEEVTLEQDEIAAILDAVKKK